LHVAAQKGDVDLARTLVEFGADINAQDSEPSSVLDMAVAGGHRPFVAFLLDLNVVESKLQPQNAAKLKEMKRAIHLGKKNASKKSRTGSQASRSGVVI
jgi:ankyrin repeat protein